MTRNQLIRLAARLVERQDGTMRDQMNYQRGVVDMLNELLRPARHANPCAPARHVCPVHPTHGLCKLRATRECSPPPRGYTYQIGPGRFPEVER